MDRGSSLGIPIVRHLFGFRFRWVSSLRTATGSTSAKGGPIIVAAPILGRARLRAAVDPGSRTLSDGSARSGHAWWNTLAAAAAVAATATPGHAGPPRCHKFGAGRRGTGRLAGRPTPEGAAEDGRDPLQTVLGFFQLHCVARSLSGPGGPRAAAG